MLTTKTADIVVAIILMGFATIAAWDSIRIGSGWGTEGPKGGFFPFIMAAIALAGCVVVIRQAMKGTSSVKGSKPFVPSGGMKPVLTVFLPACGMILLTEVVGLYVSAMIYLAAYIRIVGGFRWRTVLLVSIPVPLLFYWVFEKLFLIPLPMGMFGAQILRF
jgi:hypothetical protein